MSTVDNPDLTQDTAQASLPREAEQAGEDPKGNPIWFEKTVEYAFALKYLSEYDMICPLDGDHERIGDTILGTNSLWCVIEFKLDKPGVGRPAKAELADGKKTVASSNLMAAEKAKFKGGHVAWDKLQQYREKAANLNFHHIVYGQAVDSKISLGACDYWNTLSPRNVGELLTTFSVEKKQFFDYIDVFVKAKSPAKPGSLGEDGEGGGNDDGDGDGNGDGDGGQGVDGGDKGPKGGGGGGVEMVVGDLKFTYVFGIRTDKEKKEIFFGPLLACYDLFAPRSEGPPATEDAPHGSPPRGPNPFFITKSLGLRTLPDMLANRNYVHKKSEEA